MTDIRPKDLARVTAPTAGDTVTLDGATSRSITYENLILKGTATNDSAAAGKIGEYIEAIVASGSAVSLVTGTAKDVTTLAIPSGGDWEVWCTIYFVPAATTSVTNFAAYISGTLNTQDTTPGRFSQLAGAAQVDSLSFHKSVSVSRYRRSLAAGETLHLVANATFTVSTMSAYGIIQARRAR